MRHIESVYAYPKELARLVLNRWNSEVVTPSLIDLPTYSGADKLPPLRQLEALLCTCYQASLLSDEGRPVRFRLMLCQPGQFAHDSASGEVLHALPFAQPLPLTPNELRRLSPASPLERSLIGVRRSGAQFDIWGLIHSGEQWLRVLEGSRSSFRPLPSSLVINVAAPGHLAVAKGSLTVVRLLAGRLTTPEPGVLELSGAVNSRKDPELALMREFQANREADSNGWAEIRLSFVKRIRRVVALRIVSAIRHLQHGGTVVVLPPEIAADPQRYRHAIAIKYHFGAIGSGNRLRVLALQLLRALAAECGRRYGARHVVNWRDFLTSRDPKVAELDEAISELARQIACLSAVDGAVVIGQPLDLLGFGAEISGSLAPVDHVHRALSGGLRGRTVAESSLSVGTRHRSAYRVCRALPGTSALIVSQDGSVRFVTCTKGKVVYWENVSSGALNV